MSPAHPVEVAPERLPGWVERFAASHGPVRWSVAVPEDGAGDRGAPAAWVGRAQDGSWARLEGWGPPEGEFDPAGGWLRAPGPLLVVLVRRGGYAVAVASPAGDLVRHKVGTRHVQSRTAAGGWSQQRFARRRGNQADALVEAVVGHARRVLEEGETQRAGAGRGEAAAAGGRGTRAVGGRGADAAGGRGTGAAGGRGTGAAGGRGTGAAAVAGLVVGGDRPLVAQVLDDLATGPLSRLHGLPRRELADVPDPRRAVLDDAVRRALAVRVLVQNA